MFFSFQFRSVRTHYPDSQCGPMPFARVAQHQILQSNSEAPVHRLTLDTDFAAAGPSQCVLSHLRISGPKLELTLIFCNRGSEVHFSLQGQNRQDNSNAVNRRSRRKLRSLARSQNHIYQQVDANSTTGGNSAAGVNNVQSSFGSVLSVLSQGGALIPILLFCTLYSRESA